MTFFIVNDVLCSARLLPENISYTEMEVPDDTAEITVPHGVKTIALLAFSNCPSLRRIHLPDTLKSIQSSAFDGCTSLMQLRIPKSVRFLGDSVFDGCTNLRELFICRHHLRFKKAFRGCRCITVPAFDAVPAELHRACAMGFAGHEEMYSDVLRRKYLTHIRKNGSSFCKAAFEHPPLLRLMCRENLIKAKYIKQFEFHALRCGNVELTAMMLEYKRTHLPADGFDENCFSLF